MLSISRYLNITGLIIAFGASPLGADSLKEADSTVAEDGVAEDAQAEDAPARVSFYRDIRPIIQEHCQGCHQPAKAGGKFVITSFSDLMKGGRSKDPIVVPGKPEESLLVEQIIPVEGDPPAMPKDRKPLGETSVELIRRWIAEGAEDDSPPAAKVRFTMENPPSYESPPVLTSLDFSPDGTLLAVSGYHEVFLHRADGGELVARLVGLSQRIESVVFSPDGKLLAVTGGSPGRVGEVQVWEVEKKKLRLSVPVTYDTVYGASWSPDGTRVAFGCADNTLRAIDAETGEEVLFQGAHNDWVLDTAFSTDASHLVSVSQDRSMKLTQVKTQQFMDNITSITPGALKGGLMAVDRHPKKDELLVGGADGVPKIYQMYRTKDRKIGDDYNLIRKFEALPGRVFAAAYNGDGSRIVVGSSHDGSGEVRVYQEEDAKLLWAFKAPGAVYAATFSPDGKIVAAGGFDGVVWLLDVDENGKLVREFVPVPRSENIRKNL